MVTVAETWAFTPPQPGAAACKAAWDGTQSLAVTVAATGAQVATFAGQSLSGLAAPLAQFAGGDPAGGAAVLATPGGLALDPVTADYAQIVPATAAGASLLAARADHAHADPSPLPADFLAISWSSDPGGAGASGLLTLGTLTLVEFFVRAPGQTITNICAQVTTGQAGTSGQNFAGIYDSTGTLRGATADQTTNWTSAAARVMALTSAFTNVPVGRYYAAFLVNGTTSPTFRFSAATTALANSGLAGANLRFASQGAGLTSLPGSITLASNVTTNAQAVSVVLT